MQRWVAKSSLVTMLKQARLHVPSLAAPNGVYRPKRPLRAIVMADTNIIDAVSGLVKGVADRVMRHPAQTVAGCVASTTLLVASNHGKLDVISDLAAEVNDRPDVISPETWVLALLLSSAGRLAVGIAACLWIARWVDRRSEERDMAIAILAQRQRTLQVFSTEILDGILSEAEGTDEGTIQQFAAWYMQQLQHQQLLLEQVARGDEGQHESEGQGPLIQLRKKLDKLGFDIDTLWSLPQGEIVALPPSQEQGRGNNARQQRTIGGIVKKDAMFKERQRLERALHMPPVEEEDQYHPSWLGLLHAKRAALEKQHGNTAALNSYEVDVSSTDEESE